MRRCIIPIAAHRPTRLRRRERLPYCFNFLTQRDQVFGTHSTIGPTQMRSTWRTPPKNVELMPQHQHLGLQLLSRLEAVAQHADEQQPDCNHAAIMF
jgi:hypothetical protein